MGESAFRVRRIIVHRLTLQVSPAPQRHGGWVDGIAGFRSLRPRRPSGLQAQRSKAAARAESVLRRFGACDAADAVRARGGACTDEQILGHRFPERHH